MAIVEVVEQSVVGKLGDPQLCEDAIIATDWFVAVVDGATDCPESGLEPSPGRRAQELIVAEIACLPQDCDARAAVDGLSDAVRRGGFDGAASVVVYSRHRHEIWQIGDTRYWWSGLSETVPLKLIDRLASDARAAFTKALLAEGCPLSALLDTDPGRDFILPLLERQGAFRNSSTEWAYGAIDGTPVPDDLVEVVAVPDGVLEIVLHSDGYPTSCPTLREAEHELKTALDEDPLCINRIRGTKGLRPGNRSFDDRAYIRFSIGDERR